MSGLISALPGAATVDASSSRAVRWAALGDSFTAGTSPGERTWSLIVSEQLAPFRRVEVTNLARVGARASEVEMEQLDATIELEPDVVTVICGGNDVIGQVRPRIDDFRSAFTQIWERLATGAPAASVLTATYPVAAPDAMGPRTRERITRGLDELNHAIRDVAAGFGGTCIELTGHPGQGDRRNFAADGLHPSPSGHRAAAAVIGPAIRTALLLDRDTQPEPEPEDQ
jgi:lysophospholipase L1-like esterase